MKILSCYIENYGALSKKDYAFDGNLTVFNEDNGYGKSTLASFIKAMFYGLDGYRANYSKDEKLPERLHYYPFSGGNFGGNLTFEFNDKVYKIERFFGEKSDLTDTLKVYCNGEETFEFANDIGKVVFGVDKQSFERIAFIGSDDIDIKSTSSINVKLNEFLQGGGEDVSFDIAVSKLDAKSKEYKKSRLSSNPDKITLEQEKINDLTSKIVNARSTQIALNEKFEKLFALKGEITSLSKEIEEAQKTNKIISDYEHLEELLALAENSKVKSEEVIKKYGAIPLDSELSSYSNALVKERELKASLSSGLTEEEKEEYKRLFTVFKNGIPTAEEVSNIEDNVNKLSSLTATKRVIESEVDTERTLVLKGKFASACPSSENVKKADAIIEDYKALKSEVENLSRGQAEVIVDKKRSSKFFLPFAIISAIILIAGVPLIFLNAVLGAIISAVGFISLIAVAFLYLNAKSSKIYYNTQAPALTQNISRLNSIETEIGYFLKTYGYSLSDGIVYAYSSFKRDYLDYLEILKSERDKSEKLISIESSEKNIIKLLVDCFSRYEIKSSNYLSGVAELKSKVNSYQSLSKRVETAKLKRQSLESEVLSVQKTISDFNGKYGVSSEDFNALLTAVNLYKTEVKNYQNLTNRAEVYKSEKGLTSRPSGEIIDLSALNSKLISYQEDLALLSSQIDYDEEIVDKLDGYVAEKALAEENLKTLKNDYKLLVATRDFLVKAEQNLKDRYVKPVKDEFVKYSALLEKTLGEKVTMTKNFEITFERNGKERSEKHLSSGVKSICALCFRLALIKNMYRETSPFLILDDPFVFLDEEHFNKVSAVIKELSRDMQIIYFTCHDSRVIKNGD